MKKLVLAAMMATTPVIAQAVVIEGSFSGSIYDSYDYNNVFGYGTGHDQGVGQTITGTFRYDTGLAPSDSNGNSQIGHYATHGNDAEWLRLTFNISGNDFNISSNDILSRYDGYDLQQVYMRDDVYNQDVFGIYERDYDQAFSYSGGYTQEFYGTYGNAWVADSINDIIDGDGLIQSFEWLNDNITAYGSAFLSWQEKEYVEGKGFTYYESAWMGVVLKEMTVIVNPTDVPDPQNMGLMGLGLIGMILLRRRQNNK